MSADSDFFGRVRMPGNPVAAPDAQVRIGNARITVLTSRLLRLEWSPTREFDDRGSYAFPNRHARVPAFHVCADGDTTVMDTGELVLRYTPDDRPFHAGNLSVQLRSHPRTRWVPGLEDTQNLGGARRTIDECRGDAALELGLVSRSGWAVFDDTAGVLFAPDGGWVEPRQHHEGLRDQYFFGYGHDYAAAVSEYLQFGGPIPLVPRWVLGAWWSRYWAYSEDDVRALIGDFRSHDVPLDVVVLDMDWHTPGSWTGYSWNRELFPDPRGFLDWLHSEGLHATLNLHPALGVQPFEDAYPAFAAAMAVNPAGGQTVPFRIADRAFARNYFELLHHPIEDDGVDFWWVDWQQGRTCEMHGLDPLPWLNHLHFADMSRHPDRRPLVFSRWGGLGSHRYPVGFSGDSFALWSALQFQPRYTAAGANVGYSWWSHDIGGHIGPDDPELYVRWVQFGALSPVLRLHSHQSADAERRPWMFGEEALDATRGAFRMRYELIPYLYTAARTASDTGASVVRPTAWIAPEQDGAYLARYQYLLGDAIIAAPVVHPAEPSTGLASVDVWLPEGDWLERSTGEAFTGPRWVRLVANLAQVPQFVRAGTVLPLADVAMSTAARPSDHLVLSVFPGARRTTRVYTDDGTSSGYLAGQYTWTSVTADSPSVSQCVLAIGAAEGDGPEVDRRFTVRLEGTTRPEQVSVDGEDHDDWRYQPDTATTVVELALRSSRRATTVTVTADAALTARGPEHDRAVRAADLRRLLGDGTLADDAVAEAVRGLPAEHPSRPAAVARIGGPFVRIFEYTAPDEARATLGRVVVAAAEHGPPVIAEAGWTLERGGSIESWSVGPVEVGADAAVFDAPFRWDGSPDPTRWSVEVTATWGSLVLAERHESATLFPDLGAWRAAAVADSDELSGRRLLGELAGPSQLDWQSFHAEPGGIDFPDLTKRFAVPLWIFAENRSDASLVAYAAATIAVPDDREIAFSYQAGGSVDVHVDGAVVEADVGGNGPAFFNALYPTSRRTASIDVAAGEHVVVFTCRKPGDMPHGEWFLTANAIDPADGRIALDIAAVGLDPATG